ncbi:hypothetical protein PBY51_020559 [Eleginops maclovinus]|uniref:Uncharacterized protein n=1 Tax=Eleginops maclovinus TaxID=56733 RepID=A0AAN7XS60_ELEMC|nr:hypothetical protein PBY51_020559 [Eleginops maclovinus]
MSFPVKGPKQPDSGRKVRPTRAAEASTNREGLKGFKPCSHMFRRMTVSSSLLDTVSKQTAPENTNNTSRSEPRASPKLNNKAAATLLTTTPLKKTTIPQRYEGLQALYGHIHTHCPAEQRQQQQSNRRVTVLSFEKKFCCLNRTGSGVSQ